MGRSQQSLYHAARSRVDAHPVLSCHPVLWPRRRPVFLSNDRPWLWTCLPPKASPLLKVISQV